MAVPAIGSTVAAFTLWDANGKEQSLGSLKGKNGTVLIFISAKCPVVKAYNARMELLAHDYASRGINVVGINPNATETTDDMKAHAADNKLTFPMLRDKGNKIADTLGATVTPEAYLLDANNKLVYHGRIDNSRSGDSITSSELRDAMDAMLGGKPVAKTDASAFGCSIKRAS
jgi:peroxiredoxin